MSDPRRKRRLWQGRLGDLSSLVPLLVFSLVGAVFMTQSSATLAHSFFQSPVSPLQTPAPAATPTGVEPGPPDESPVVPPSESPVVPPEGSPGVLPSGTPVAPEGPRLTPSVGARGEVSGAEPPSGEAGPGPASEDSLAVLVDALVVGLSTLWLCCGGVALVIFFLLVVASFLLRVT